MIVYDHLDIVMGLMNDIISKKWEKEIFFQSFLINSMGQYTILFLRSDNLTVFCGEPNHEEKRLYNGIDLLFEVLEPENTTVADYPQIRLQVTELDPINRLSTVI